jgi:hypothetical protein
MPEKLAEGSLFCLFLKLVQINFIFTDNVRILYIYICVRDINFASVSAICRLDIGTVPTVCFFSIFFSLILLVTIRYN